jgi:hypothetical protein
LNREWGGMPATHPTGGVTQSGIFTSAAPKYQYVTMTAYSEKVVSNLFVSPAAPARRGGGH